MNPSTFVSRSRHLLGLWLLVLNLQGLGSFAQSTAFTYQGRLDSGGSPANGIYDLRFKIYDSGSGGIQQGPTLTNSPVSVSDGLFTVVLNFGYDVFTGDPRWLEVAVRTNGDGAFTPLMPRQPITATPYAHHAEFAGNIAPDANVSFSGPVTFGYQLGQPFYLGPGVTNLVQNLNAQYLAGRDAGRFWWLGGNSGQLPGDYVLGTLDNSPLEFKVNGQRALRVEPNATSPNLIGGYSGNVVSNGFAGAVIGGGGQANNPNRVGANFASVLGGYNNTAAGFAATAIGLSGTARGDYSTVIGVGNSSLGNFSMLMGVESAASGDYATAMGIRAHANHAGSFVWSDLTEDSFLSTAANQFLIRSAGGVGINTNNPHGAALAVNGDVTVNGSFKSGFSGNIISNGVVGGFIGGGGDSDWPNVVGGDRAAILGGRGNQATGTNSIAMGSHTRASGLNSTAMGYSTRATNEAATALGYATYANGQRSTAMGSFTVASGFASTATGNMSEASGDNSISIGYGSQAAGSLSMAAGYQARALHSGTFVWADVSQAFVPFNSTSSNQFLIRAIGGVGIGTPNPGAMLQVGDVNQSYSQGMMRFASRSGTGAASRYWDIGVPQGNENTSGKHYSFVIDDPQIGTEPEVVVRWDTGNVGIGLTSPASKLHVNGTVTATAFNPPSDRNLKENFTPVDPQEVLAKVAALPISRWNFIGDSTTPHVGPMAQDFHVAFGLGTDERHIATVDADGVALAAIQGLNAKVESGKQKAETRIANLEAENAELKQRLVALEKLVATQLNVGLK